MNPQHVKDEILVLKSNLETVPDVPARTPAIQERKVDIPKDEYGNLLSIGSIYHASGLCQPCAFNKNSTCFNKSQCLFCHYDHDENFYDQKRAFSLSSTLRQRQVTLMNVDPSCTSFRPSDEQLVQGLQPWLFQMDSPEYGNKENNAPNGVYYRSNLVDENFMINTQNVICNNSDRLSIEKDNNSRFKNKRDLLKEFFYFH